MQCSPYVVFSEIHHWISSAPTIKPSVSPKMTPTRAYIELTTELLIISLPTFAFLYVFAFHFGQGIESAVLHAGIIALILLNLVAIRLLISLIWAPLYRGLSTSLLFLLLVTGTLYYSLVIIGLYHWNQVISWDLLRTYSSQLEPLFRALGIPLLPSVLAVFAVTVVLFFLLRAWVKATVWPETILRRWSPVTSGAIILAAPLMLSTHLFATLADKSTWRPEPIWLTFGAPAHQFQNQTVDDITVLRLDHAEQQERLAYKSSDLDHRRNLVLIMVDALRPDHMSVLGYERQTTPFLEDLGRSRFMQAMEYTTSTCSESLCGIMGILSSRYAHQLSRGPITIHEVLARHGYRSMFVLSGDHTNFYGLRQLYGPVDMFFDGTQSHRYMNDDELVIDFLKALPPWEDEPTVFVIHLMSSHLLGERRLDPKFVPERRYGIMGSTAQGDGLLRSEGVVNFYDNGVLQTDHYIERALSVLEKKGYLDDALVIVTADHGEALGEGGLFGHAKGVVAPMIRVPLIFYHFGHEPTTRFYQSEFASVIDIAPTIAQELGIAIPATWRGNPLQERPNRTLSFFQHNTEAGLIDHSNTSKPIKFSIDMRTGESGAYDLAEDPFEFNDVMDRLPAERISEWMSLLDRTLGN